MPDTLDDLMARDDAPARPRRRRWPWGLGILAVLIAVLAGLAIAGVALAGQALEVRDDLEAAQSELSSVPALVREGDTDQFDAAAASVLAHTTRADETVQGPLWEIATWIPGVGPNIGAVREATAATHILVRDALPASFEVLGAVDIDKIRFAGGGFNLDPFRTALGVLPEIDAAFASAQEHVDRIDRDALLPIVDDAVGQVVEVIDETAPLVHTATEVLPTALQILGDDEPRTYFVMFQNNAEIRATGGNPAASVLIRVDAGRVALSDQASSTTFATPDLTGRQFVDLPAETTALYDDEWARYSQNYTKTPSFPTSARLFQGILAETGREIDGVLSLDPVALSHMLAVAGPVDVDGYQITSDNVVQVLLEETYLRFPGDQAPADAFFAAASASVFDKLVRGRWDPLEMIEALRTSVDEQRVYAWFPREEEEAVAAELGIDGRLAADNESTTEVGIFLNDSAVGKLEYYLRSEVDVRCDVEARTVTTTVSVTNTLDRDDLTFHMLARRSPTYGGSKTTMMLDVLYVAPPGATVDRVEVPGGAVDALARTGIEGGRQAESVTVLVDRGQTRTVSYTSRLPEQDLGAVSVRHTPTVTDTPVSIADSCADVVGTFTG
ncbi:DUF4012 domain-containing protein [Microbacterium sp. Marseille-Q6648]|uniref:DUF4012 domain-containing protein n=1 Tax=Microbacterium sp. Marseille-Q6648 TaxID=2937991 RepID=UPI00204033DD|nr:DUF4012 domain-containing protein [Microbacterium sp. Marseille-Q6648]